MGVMGNVNAVNVVAIRALKDNYIWLLVDESQKTAVIVDPGEAKPVLDYLAAQALTPLAILITHHHWDHVNGITEIKDRFDIPVYAPATEDVPLVTTQVHEDADVNVPDFPVSFKALFIPGHTKGHIAYYAPGMLFCGDTLFAAGCGRLFEGTASQMAASLQKILSLPNDTKIYCAHEYTLSNLSFAATVEPDNRHIQERIVHVTRLREQDLPSLPSSVQDEKDTNPFLRCTSPQVIASAEKYAG